MFFEISWSEVSGQAFTRAFLASADPNDHRNGKMIPVAWPRESGTHECTPIRRKKQQGNYSTQTKQHTGIYEKGPYVAHTRGEASLQEGQKAIGHASESGPSETQMTRAWKKVNAFFTKRPIRAQDQEVNGFMEVSGAQRKGNF